ncbi:hypothetical protein Tco_0713280 [Tanacetum coccineum]
MISNTNESKPLALPRGRTPRLDSGIRASLVIDALCERFHVPDTVHPELPVRNDRIRNSPTGKIGGKQKLDGEVPLLDLTRGRVVPLPSVNDQGNADVQGVGNDDVNEESGDAVGANHVEENDHAVQDEGDNIVRIEDEVPASVAERAKSTLLVEVGVAARPTERFIVLSDSSQHSSTNDADDEVTSIVRSSMPPPLVLTATVATTIIADTTFALVPKVGIELVPYIIFRDSVSTGEANQDVVACQTCLSYEVRLWLEHELRGRKKFEGKCAMQTDWLNEKDAEIASLKARLSLKEAEATEAICLRGQVTNVEAAEAARVNELNGLKERTMALKGQVAALEFVVFIKDIELAASLKSEKDKLADQVSTLEATCSGLRDEVSGHNLFKEHIEAVQDKQVRVLSDCVAGLESKLMEMALYMDEEFYPRYLTTIAGRRWILGHGLKLADGLTIGIDHGKAGIGLVDVAAYNPSMEANYVSAINALRVVVFSLLAQLESEKDVSIADIMDLLYLEGPVVETLEASQLQPSPEQLMLPIHRLEDQVRIRGDVASRWLSLSNAMVPLIEPLSFENLVGEASTFGVPEVVTTTALSTTFIQASSVPPILVADDGVLGAE